MIQLGGEFGKRILARALKGVTSAATASTRLSAHPCVLRCPDNRSPCAPAGVWDEVPFHRPIARVPAMWQLSRTPFKQENPVRVCCVPIAICPTLPVR
jgi:hypothetical protein